MKHLSFLIMILALFFSGSAWGATLEWDANSDADTYTVYIQDDAGAWVEAESGIKETSWAIPALAGDAKEYMFSVKAFSACGNSSDYSDTVTFMPCMDKLVKSMENVHLVLSVNLTITAQGN